VKFINCNVTSFDAAKHSGLAVLGDARATIEALSVALSGWQVEPSYRARASELARDWDDTVERAYHLGHEPLPAQSEVIGAVNAAADPRDVVVCAAGSMPGDLHKLWRSRDAKSYHVEYGYSCMGYEIAGGLGVKMAAPDRDVYVMVGDGSYLMMSSELVTAVQEQIKIIIVLVQNYGFASIGGLSESVGAQRFGTAYRYRNPATGRLDGGKLSVDLAANAASLGVVVHRATTIDELGAALAKAKSADGPVLISIETDPLVPAPSSDSWWDVPIAEVSELDSVTAARESYLAGRLSQRSFF
jgi:3D-(3,5/4)-trihydroxycyclohexane-1,2-dione acylhydrolase (decyclizing)